MREYRIGEVEKITGIPKRVIKYYREKELHLPKLQSSAGYCMYTDEDIKELLQIRLYSKLEYSIDEIKSIISKKGFNWDEELDSQIMLLREKRKEYENLVYAAETLRYMNKKEYWSLNEVDMTIFKNDINYDADEFNAAIYTKLANPYAKSEKERMILEQLSSITDEQGEKFLELLLELKEPLVEDVESDSVQKVIRGAVTYICGVFSDEKLDCNDLLYTYRIFRNIGGIDFIINAFYENESASDLLEKALQVYCNNEYVNANPEKSSKGVSTSFEDFRKKCLTEIAAYEEKIKIKNKKIKEFQVEINYCKEKIEKTKALIDDEHFEKAFYIAFKEMNQEA